MLKTAFLAFAVAAAATTSASAAITYVSRSGGGTTCTQTAPCNNMETAIIAAGAGGEVVCLDKGNYGGAGIGFAITISCGDGLWEIGNGTMGIVTGPGTTVVIEGLIANGLAFPDGVQTGFHGGGSVHLHRVRIGNNPGLASVGFHFAPTDAGATLHVSESVFFNNRGHGIFVRPSGVGYANVHMSNVRFENNGNGLFIDGSTSTIGINVNVTGGVFASNSANGIGVFSTAGKAGINVSVKDAQITGNLGNGVGALASSPSGAGSVTVEIGSSMITGNVYGVSASGAAQIRTFGNNQLRLNGNNGAFTGSVGLQ